MTVEHQTNQKKGLFFILENDKHQAEMTYTYAGDDKIIIDHTEVYPGNEGRGLGKMLVKAAVEFAREKHLKILPLCPFAKNVFDKSPDYSDVLF